MAFDLGSIRARMGLDPGGFVSGLRSAETAAEIFGPKIVDLVNNPLLGTIRIVKEAGAAFAGLVVDVAQQNKALDDWARRLGVSTEILSALSAEARRLDIEMEDVADAIGELAVKARDGVNGSEDLLKTFERLGVSVTDRNGELRDLESILLDTARGLADVTNETERYAIADELGSDAAKRLLPLLVKLGREGYDPLVVKARQYGQLIDGEAAAASNKLAGALDDLGLAVDGVKRGMATDFIVGFSREFKTADGTVGDAAATLRTQMKPVLEDIGELAGSSASQIGALTDYLRDFAEGIEAVETVWNRVKDNPLIKIITAPVRLQTAGVSAATGFFRDVIAEASIGGVDEGILTESRRDAIERAEALRDQLREQNQRQTDIATGAGG